jgi:hypothetical protein
MDLVLDVDDGLYDRLSKRAVEQGFESPEAYARIVVETVLDELETTESRATGTDRTAETDADSGVQDRLEDLGYL